MDSRDPVLTRTRTYRGTIDQWLPSDSGPSFLRSLKALGSASFFPGVPVLLLWVPVQELGVLLLSDSVS